MSTATLAVIEDATQAASILNPTRRRLLTHLMEPDSAAGLARRLKLPRQVVNYHLRQLEAEALVRVVEERRKRNCVERVVQATAQSYVISPAALGVLAADPERFDESWSSAYLIAAAARIVEDVSKLRRATGPKMHLPTLAIQVDVRFASPVDQHAFTYELADAMAQLVTKYHREDAPKDREFSVALLGHPRVDHAVPPVR